MITSYVAGLDAVPRHAPGRQFAHRLGRHVGEHARDFLVVAPVAAAHGVLEMHVLVVAGALQGIGQAGLHAALGGGRMRTLGRHQAEDDHLLAALLRCQRGAQTGQSAADDEDVAMDDFHFSVFPWSTAVWPGGT
jgi:hypothetical protein